MNRLVAASTVAGADVDCRDPALGEALAAWGDAGFSGSVAVLGDGEATVTFTDDELAVAGPAGTVTARRVG